MSNKITLAIIQFRADTKGVNPALDAMRQSAKDAHDEMDRMQEALDKGIKKMKDANGVEFDVADKFRQAQKAAKSYDQALRELVKGATALESVVQNIRLGEIEKSSRAELKGAINAAEARKRSVRETDPEDLEQQRDLNKVIEESRKQLNNLDRDTQKVIETLDKGGIVAQATLDKEIKGLKEILTLIPKGTDEWNKYNQQLTQMEALIAGIKRHDFAEQAKILGDIDLGKYKETDIRSAIDAGRELIKTYTTGSDEAKMLAQYIVRAEEHLKNYGVEAERSARREIAAQEEAKRKIQEKLDMMTGRMADVSKLTDAALQETKKFWEEQHAGAERGSKEALEYEKHIKTITDEQERIANSRRADKANGLLGDLNAMSEKEIREAIEAARQLQQSLSVNDKLYQQFSVAIVNAEEHVKRYGIEAERAARKEAAAQEEAARKLKEKQDQMLLRMQNLGQLTREGLEETKKFWEAQLVGAKRGSDEALRYETFIKTITAEQEHLSRLQAKQGAEKLLNADVTMSEGEMRKAIDDAKKYLQTLSLTDDEYKNIAGAIAGAEEYIKRFGLEAERSAMQASMKMDDMNKRMADISKLSDAALQETRKFWEEQFAGAERGSSEAKKYEDNIKAIAKEQERIAAERTKTTAQSIYGNLDKMSEGEIRRAIEAAKQYQQTLSVTDSEYKRMSQTILDAEEYIKNYGIEAERAARKEAEAQAETNRKLQEKMDLMTTRMSDVTRLTDQALQETKKYWEAQLAGVERNSDAAKVYEGHIRTITEEQTRLINEQNRLSSQKLFGNLDSLSEGEIRKSIEAAKQYQQTLSVTDDEYRNLSRAILDAEEHVKKYGIEGERAARREIEAMEKAARKREETEAMMFNQLRQGMSLTKEALKTQEQFWRKAIDDPKNAGQNVEWYKDRLQEVKDIQQQLIMEEGRNALDWFTSGQNADATGDEIKKRADALKAYKGTLRQTTDASDIAEIDRILESLAKKADAAKGELMSLAEALEIVDKIDFDQDGKLLFEGTTEQIIGAKNALEKELAVVQRGSDRYNELREKVDKLNDAINETRINQAQVDAILASPKTASYDQLKMAIDASRKKLNSMRHDTKEQQKEFEELANKVKEADYQMKQLAASSKGTASAWEKAFSRLKTYVVMYMGFNEVWQKVSNTARDLMDLSDRMGEVRKTTGFTADEVGRLTDNLKKIDTRTSLVALTELSAKAGQLGLKSAEDVMGFTEAANKMLVALPEMGADGATQMMKVALATGEVDKIRKQMEEGTIEGSSATAVAMEKIASTIDQLRANSAAAAPQITDFVKRVGAVGAQSGISIDQVAALGSTVDALGMRVEMSATALSRMIPAIKRNAFDVAHAIGMAPEALRAMFDEAGGGMNAMLAIFQHIKDAGMREDDIEKMLGMGEMAEIMKELNQQGARAGIVFAGLSQNVDVLREHLGIANKAYKENIAIQQEYDRMNETTAAKWERLKNQFEEMWVGDQAQRWLGYIIDGLRKVVDLISGPLNGALVGLAAGYGTFKAGIGGAIGDMLSFGEAENDAGSKWEELWEKIKEKNVWDLVVSGAVAAGVALWQYMDSLQEAAREQARFNREVVEEQDKLEDLTNSINTARESVNTTTKDVEAAKKEVEAAKAALDGTKESTDRLTEANSKLLVAEEKKRSAMVESKRLIGQFNNEYSKYLGFMLSEVSTSYELEKARDLLNTKIRETISLKRKEAALGRIEEEEGEDRDKAYSDLSVAISGAFRRQVVVGHDANGKEIKEWTADRDKNTRLLRNLTKMAQQEQLTAQQVEKALADAGLKIYETTHNGEKRISAYGANIRNLVMNYRKEYQSIADQVRNVETQFEVEASIDREETQGKLAEQYKASEKRYAQLETSHAEATGEARKKAAADLLKQADTLEEMITAAPNYYDLRNNDEKASYEKFVSETQARIDGIKNQREALLKEAGKYYTARDKAGGGRTTSIAPVSPWGSNAPADSTDYSLFDVNELVARRNQMDKFKNILKPDTDVRTVLAEDKALMKALDNGLKSDWESVLDWYNAERKKIQEELKSERFSTNTGHWRDEKNGRGRKNRFRESDYALAELDRYYSRRKEKLEKAREEEGMSEELFNREAELLEQEHLERRSKLRETFTAGTSKQEQEMVKQFRLWWDKLEKSGDLDEVPWATVESEWAKALASEIGRNNLKAQQDLTQLQSITVKHLNQIAKLIDQERPYDGITANLRKNLTEMDILLADMVKDGPAEDTAKLVSEQGKRLQFLLTEAEHAYALTFDDLAKKMREQGLGDWADALMIDEQKKQSLMQNLRNVYDQIQEAIKKEASIIKKQLEIQWNDMLPGQEMSMKGTFEKAISDLGLAGDQVKRANSLIGAGAASERVADKLAIQQMKVQLAMQQTYFALMQKIGDERVRQLRLSAEANDREAKALKARAEQLRKEGKATEAETTELRAQIAARQALQDSFDAEHAQKSLNLAKTKEIAEEEKQRVAIQNQLEESQNRLYTELRSWADLLASSLQGVFEASHAGDAEYYNERAKLNLTGKGGPGAGTYVVIDDAGTSDATAHYEYLDERQALERQHEIEVQNAQAEAWRKLMDDLNMKMSEQITDWINAAFQNQAIDANTQAVLANTQAIYESMGLGGEGSTDFSDPSKMTRNAQGFAVDSTGQVVSPIQPTEEESAAYKAPWQMTEDDMAKGQENMGLMWQSYAEQGVEAQTSMAEMMAEMPGITPPWQMTDEQLEAGIEKTKAAYQGMADASKDATSQVLNNQQKIKQGEQQTDKQIASSSSSAFAKMTQAANMYGIAYQVMQNDNLSASQKFGLMAVQAAGQAAITSLTVNFAENTAQTAADTPSVLSKLYKQLGWGAIPVFAVFTGLLGGLLGLAASKIAKSKSEIAQATGASVGAGRLATGMLTYAEGNVNELTDPASLTPGRQYNVDGADGKTYRARYMGKGAKTHITNGPEFHLVGEAGREAIIDAKTTRLLQMNETGIWRDIQTLYNGGSISGLSTRRRRGGVRAFADGNVGEFEEMADGGTTAVYGTDGMGMEQMLTALDRNSAIQEALLERLNQPIYAQNILYGPDGLPNVINKLNKEAQRHGEKYL